MEQDITRTGRPSEINENGKRKLIREALRELQDFLQSWEESCTQEMQSDTFRALL